MGFDAKLSATFPTMKIKQPAETRFGFHGLRLVADDVLTEFMVSMVAKVATVELEAPEL